MGKFIGGLGVYAVFSLVMIILNLTYNELEDSLNTIIVYSFYFAFLFTAPLIIVVFVPTSFLAGFLAKKINKSRNVIALFSHLGIGIIIFIAVCIYIFNNTGLDLNTVLQFLVFIFLNSFVYWLLETRYSK